MARPAISGFGIFDHEWARLVHRVSQAAARLERVKALSSTDSVEYQVALFGFKDALSGVRAAATKQGNK